MGWRPVGLLSSPALQNLEDGMQNMIVGYHCMGSPRLCKQDVGKPSHSAAHLCAKADGCVPEDLMADKP